MHAGPSDTHYFGDFLLISIGGLYMNSDFRVSSPLFQYAFHYKGFELHLPLQHTAFADHKIEKTNNNESFIALHGDNRHENKDLPRRIYGMRLLLQSE